MTTSPATPASEHHEKIAKLLAKAEGTDNPHEAEAFTKAAEKLLIKWGIDEAVVRAQMTGEQSTEEIITLRIEYTDTYSDAYVSFTSHIAEGLDLRCYYHRGYQHDDQRLVYVVGHESDVQRAGMLLASLRLQAASAMKTWWRTSGYSAALKGWKAFKARRQFIISFGAEVGQRLAALRVETIAETGGSSTELVLLDRSARIDTWMEENIGELKTTRGVQGSAIGFREGRQAGRRADIGNNVTGGDSAALDR